MAKSGGVKGSAVFAGTAALYLVYVGVKDVPFFEGLRELFRKKTPTPRIRAPKTTGSGTGNLNPTNNPGVTPTGRIVVAPGTGIRVDAAIANNVSALIRDAAKAGLRLSGSGYRSHVEQAALRIKNGCPKDPTAPASECKIPTAPVGQSMHEIGLAIDFRWFTAAGGKIVRGDAADKWLLANAPKYGLHNLPSEAWHYSTNGH